MNKRLLQILWIVLALLVMSGCSGLPSRQAPAATGDLAATQQAVIVYAVQATATTMAMQTQISQLQTQVAQGSGGAAVPTAIAGVTTEIPLSPTSTLVPTSTQVPPTLTPSLQPTPTLAPIIVTPIVATLAPTATPQPCNQAQYVQDVTIADGSVLTAGSNFTKTWRLKNSGTCTWTTAYDIIFSGGDAMSGPAAVDLPGNVAPGDTIDISVNLVAPNSDGRYRGDWKLRDGSGVVFGLGKTNAAFYVDIKVSSPQSNFPLDFVAKMCQAEWSSSASILSCPGSDNSSRGFVFRLDKPTLESGYIDDEAALLTHPQMINDGVIRGKYPSVRVEAGHHFRAIIGCEFDSEDCDVNFQLDYQIGDGSIQTLKTWHEVYDQSFVPVDVSLDSLAGKDVRFILTVMANGSSDDDRALWLAPRIVK